MDVFDDGKLGTKARQALDQSFSRPNVVVVEQGLTSHQTHYRSYWGWVFYGSNNQTNSIKALKEDRS